MTNSGHALAPLSAARVLKQTVDFFQFYGIYFRSLHELNAMTDIELADIGLTRGLLKQTAREDAEARLSVLS